MRARTTILAGLLGVSPALAVGPSHQTVSAVSAVVQMRPDDSPLDTTATGSVVRKVVDTSGVGWLCVLTADHVVESGYTHIGFGDGNPTGTTFGGDDSLLFRAPLGGADVAVVGVRYGTPDAFFDSLNPLSLAPASAPSRVGTVFSQLGYGWTGEMDFAGSRMVTVPRAGVMGFQNNTVERVRQIASPFLPYSYTALEWDFNAPGGPGAVDGEGSSFNGDSGAPYLIESAVPVVLGDGSTINVFTRGIGAVHTYGDSTAYHGWLGSGDHIPGGGVAITPELADWIEAQCLAVPAPGGGLVLIVLAGVGLRRARRG